MFYYVRKYFFYQTLVCEIVLDILDTLQNQCHAIIVTSRQITWYFKHLSRLLQ